MSEKLDKRNFLKSLSIGVIGIALGWIAAKRALTAIEPCYTSIFIDGEEYFIPLDLAISAELRQEFETFMTLEYGGQK